MTSASRVSTVSGAGHENRTGSALKANRSFWVVGAVGVLRLLWVEPVMPFHVGGHKPQPSRAKSSRFGLKGRLKVAGGGALLLLCGFYRTMNGVLFVINWYGQVVYSDLLIAIGAVLIVFALI